MGRFGIVGGSYTSQSVNADAQMTMGWYPEQIESGAGASSAALYPTPGTALFATLDDTPVRGQIYVAGRAFAVGGSSFAEVFADGTHSTYGTVASDGLPVSMAAGTNQILIASAGLVYVFTLSTNGFAALPVGTLTNVNQVGYCDGFFLACLRGSNTFQASALLDATTWPPLSTGSVNVFVDTVGSLFVDHRTVWLFGLTKTVVYYNSGNFPFPFDLIPGAFIEQGIIANNSPVRLDNSIFWLGGDDRGNGIAWRASGYTPTRVSNHAIEFAWQGYAKISDAVGYSYQDQGHSFWVLYFPSANKTWVFDVATGQWHERGYWNKVNGLFTAHRSQNHVAAFGKHLVGDWFTGNIYSMSISLYDDAGNPIRRVRRAPHIVTEQEWIFHHELQVDLETGVEPQPPVTIPVSSSSPASFNLQDGSGTLWAVKILDTGILTTTNIGAGTAPTVFLNDSSAIGTSWQLAVAVNGLLALVPALFSPSYPLSISLATNPKLYQGILRVSSGLLQTTVTSTQPVDPTINLRWSDDGGHTWSNLYSVGAGQAGAFKTRAIWRRLGRARSRIYEISVSDAVAWRLVDAYLKASPGFTASERIVSQYRKVS